MQSAKSAAQAQAQMAARAAAEDQAAAAVSRPLGQADVQINADPTQSVTAARRNKRASYGTGYSSGVSI